MSGDLLGKFMFECRFHVKKKKKKAASPRLHHEEVLITPSTTQSHKTVVDQMVQRVDTVLKQVFSTR